MGRGIISCFRPEVRLTWYLSVKIEFLRKRPTPAHCLFDEIHHHQVESEQMAFYMLENALVIFFEKWPFDILENWPFMFWRSCRLYFGEIAFLYFGEVAFFILEKLFFFYILEKWPFYIFEKWPFYILEKWPFIYISPTPFEAKAEPHFQVGGGGEARVSA